MITIVDTGVNNLGSLLRAFRQIEMEVRTTRSPRDILDATVLVLPGVGSFGVAMERLRENGLIEPILRHARERHKPMIGICLGSQLLLEGSDEHGMRQGLGLIKGQVRRLDAGDGDARVPRLGWADVRMEKAHPLIEATSQAKPFYFAHSHHACCDDPEHVIGTTGFDGTRIAAVIGADNVVGCQFHPEKSQDAGLNLLQYLARRALGREAPKLASVAS
jgi:imidazole glycerol-phosphate synthase subunit HisH